MPDLTLGAAAAALDAELRRFEQIADLLARLKLDSEKNLERAARAAQDAAHSEERVGTAAGDLVAAVARARARQEDQSKAIAERMVAIVARREELSAIVARFAQLGEQAKAINALLKEGQDLAEAARQMEKIAEGATALRDDAAARDFEEPARQADSMRQQMLSARNKLKLVERKREKG